MLQQHNALQGHLGWLLLFQVTLSSLQHRQRVLQVLLGSVLLDLLLHICSCALLSGIPSLLNDLSPLLYLVCLLLRSLQARQEVLRHPTTSVHCVQDTHYVDLLLPHGCETMLSCPCASQILPGSMVTVMKERNSQLVLTDGGQGQNIQLGS